MSRGYRYHTHGERRRTPPLRLLCALGRHRRTTVVTIEHKTYSECGYCGIDLTMSRRGWRRLRPGELPEGWPEKAQPALRDRLVPVVLAVIPVLGVLILTTLYMMLR